MLKNIIVITIVLLGTLSLSYAKNQEIEGYKALSCSELEMQIDDEKSILEKIEDSIYELRVSIDQLIHCLTTNDLRCIPGLEPRYISSQIRELDSRRYVQRRRKKDFSELELYYNKKCL